MGLQIQSNISTPFGNENLLTGNKKYGSGVPQKFNKFSLKNESLSFLSQKEIFEYSSKDGDAVSFSYGAEEIRKTNLEIEADYRKNKIKNVAKSIKEEVCKMKKVHLNRYFKVTDSSINEIDAMEKKSEISNIDEYWNAENTSQRIVDFAVSFFSVFEGNNNRYLQKIKVAITDGFSRAKEILGDISGPVSDLVNSTYDLVMDKLHSWFSDIEDNDVQEITDEQEA